MKPSKEQYIKELHKVIANEEQCIKIIDENVQIMIDKILFQASRQKAVHLAKIVRVNDELQQLNDLTPINT